MINWLRASASAWTRTRISDKIYANKYFLAANFDQSSWIFHPFRRHRESPPTSKPHTSGRPRNASLIEQISFMAKKIIELHCRTRRFRQSRMGSIQIYDKNLAIAAHEKVSSLIHLVAASPLLSLCERRWFIVAWECRRHCLSACHNSDSHNRSMCFIRVISDCEVFTAREAVLNECLSIIRARRELIEIIRNIDELSVA